MDSFAAYQNSIRPSGVYANSNGARSKAASLTHAALDLCIHAGAVADKVKKVVRDDDGVLPDDKRAFVMARADSARISAESLGQIRGASTPVIAPENEVIANKLTYLSLGLCGESAEVAEKIDAALREDGGALSEGARQGILKEAGDTLWYLTRLVDELSAHIGDVAQGNLAKVTSRRERGVTQGSGDDR